MSEDIELRRQDFYEGFEQGFQDGKLPLDELSVLSHKRERFERYLKQEGFYFGSRYRVIQCNSPEHAEAIVREMGSMEGENNRLKRLVWTLNLLVDDDILEQENSKEDVEAIRAICDEYDQEVLKSMREK